MVPLYLKRVVSFAEVAAATLTFGVLFSFVLFFCDSAEHPVKMMSIVVKMYNPPFFVDVNPFFTSFVFRFIRLFSNRVPHVKVRSHFYYKSLTIKGDYFISSD